MSKIKTAIITCATAIAVASCAQKSAESGQTKTLVLYYSQTGATKAVAEELQNRLGADIDSIVCMEPYSGTYDETIARCQREMEGDILPEIMDIGVDISKYDTIFIGYPVWFGTYARPMLSFIKSAKLDGKVIVPFCTFGSGGLNSTSDALKADQPRATVLPGYGVRNARIGSMPAELDRFLKENGFVEGEMAPLDPYSEQKAVTEEEMNIFDEACGDYQFPLGTPVTVGSRTTEYGTEYMYMVTGRGMDGNEVASVIYVIVPEGGRPEFTQVVRSPA